MGYIYKITNDINDKIYIGKTLHSTIDERFKEHCHDCFKRRMEKRPLYSAMRKYGVEHFKINLIGEYPDEQLSDMEIYWIAYYEGYTKGYNATKGGDGSTLYDHEAIVARLKECPYPIQVANEFNCGIDLIYDLVKKNNITIKSAKEQVKEKYSKQVIQLDKDTLDELAIYSSLSEAARQYLISNNQPINENKIKGTMVHISEVAKGKRKNAYGYKWQFLDDLDKS